MKKPKTNDKKPGFLIRRWNSYRNGWQVAAKTAFGTRADYENPDPTNPTPASGLRNLVDAWRAFRAIIRHRSRVLRADQQRRMQEDFSEVLRVWGVTRDNEAAILRGLRLSRFLFTGFIVGASAALMWVFKTQPPMGWIFVINLLMLLLYVGMRLAWFQHRIRVLETRKYMPIAEFLRIKFDKSESNPEE